MTIPTVQQPRCVDPSHCSILLATMQAHPVIGRCSPLHTSMSVQLAEMLLTQCWLFKMLSKVSEPAFNQQLALPKRRPKLCNLPRAHLRLLMVINLINCRPGKNNFDTLFCMSVTRRCWLDRLLLYRPTGGLP